MYMSASVGIYSLLIFLPVILRQGLGFSLTLSFLLSAPPAAFSVIFALVISWLADKYRIRGPFVFCEAILTIVGLVMIAFLDNPTPRYVGAFLGQAGANALVITSLAWGQNNVRSDAKRSVATAIQVMMASIGGIYSALVFRQQVRSMSFFFSLRAFSLTTLLGCAELCTRHHRDWGCDASYRVLGSNDVTPPAAGEQTG